MLFQISSRKENRWKDTWVIEIRVPGEVFSKKCFSDAEDNNSGPLYRGGKSDLPLFRTLLAIRQKFQEPSFWEVIDSFVFLAYAGLATSRTLLQGSLAYLNFTLDSFCWYSPKNDFY